MRAYLLWFFILCCACADVRAQQPTASAGATASPSKEQSKPLSDEVNNKLPKWLRFSGEYRTRVEGFAGGGFKPDTADAYLLSRLRLNLVVQPDEWLKFVFQAQDAHVFWKNQGPAAPPFQDTMDLRLGYLEIGDSEKKAISLRAGRQELAFGDERLIGNANWLNTARSFDGLRGSFRLPGFRVDLFGMRVVQPVDGEFDLNTPGNNFYGIYASSAKLIAKAKFEPYFLWRRNGNAAMKTGGRGILNFGTYGLRWAGNLPANFDYATEVDVQSGSVGTNSISAWAGHWLLGKTFPKWKWAPRLAAEYNFASGDDPKNLTTLGTFDQLYPTAHDKYGLCDQVGWKNIEDLRANAELKLAAKWTAASRYNAWWLANTHDALYSATNAVVARAASGTAGRFVGQEIDGVFAYNLSSQIQLAGGYGHIFPGTFLHNTTKGAAYNFPYASTTVVF